MKYYIFATAFLIGVGVWLSQNPILEVKLEPKHAEQSEVAPSPQARSKETATGADEATSIEKMTEEMLQLKSELRAIGYPKVMLDKRLSEDERARIVKKVVAASDLHNKITLLKLKQIEAEADL